MKHEFDENGDVIHIDVDPFIPTGICAICKGKDTDTIPPEDRDYTKSDPGTGKDEIQVFPEEEETEIVVEKELEVLPEEEDTEIGFKDELIDIPEEESEETK